MLKRSLPAVAAATAKAKKPMRPSAAAATTPSQAVKPLLPYAVRRAAAAEMLYGGARVQHLVQPPFPLHKVQSENLPPPSLDHERHDLGLEMQLPRDLHAYNNINMAIQRHVGADVNTPDAAASTADSSDGFNMGTYYTEHHHPERHHNSSLPYSTHDTNNVLAMRLFPVNIGLRVRTEAVRIRTEDCLQRLRDAQRCAKVGVPLEHPLPLSARSAYDAVHRARHERRHDGAAAGLARGGEQAEGEEEEAARTAHLHGAAAHPPPASLSIFTRPVDRRTESRGAGGALGSTHTPVHVRFPVHPYSAAAGTAASRGSGGSATPTRPSSQQWMPLQMLKPLGHNWSAATRSSGVRGPHMQLMQERLDQKGFGWKRKSRSLWQQDVDTAGFRPHRYF